MNNSEKQGKKTFYKIHISTLETFKVQEIGDSTCSICTKLQNKHQKKN